MTKREQLALLLSERFNHPMGAEDIYYPQGQLRQADMYRFEFSIPHHAVPSVMVGIGCWYTITDFLKALNADNVDGMFINWDSKELWPNILHSNN